MTNALKTALEQLTQLNNPSVAKILRSRHYRHEARIVEAVIDAYQYEKDMEQEPPVNSTSEFWEEDDARQHAHCAR